MIIDNSEMNKYRAITVNAALLAVLVIAVPLLFSRAPQIQQHRLEPFVWNMGHILLFFALTLLAGVAVVWKGDPILGGVVGIALAINTLFAVSIGGTVPLLIKRFGWDPALASGPILTTLTDVMGFFLTLSFATAVLV